MYGDLLKIDLAPPGSFKTKSANETDPALCFETRFVSMNGIVNNNDYRVLMRMARMGLYYVSNLIRIQCVYCDFTCRPFMESMYNHEYSTCKGVFRVMTNSINARLDSFRNWPYPDVPFVRLAESGFFYFGINNTVCCPCCKLSFTNWFNRGDDPFREHARWSKSCLLVEALKEKPIVAVASAPVLDEPVHPTVPIDHRKVATETNRSTQAMNPTDRSLQDDTDLMCKVCFERERNVCFVPCRHVSVCENCAQRCQSCCVCRQKISSLIRVFL